MLCGLPVMEQAAVCDCLAFDLFPFDKDGLTPPEVDVGGRQVVDALVITQVIVVSDEGLDVGFEVARQVIVLEQDAVLHKRSLMETSPEVSSKASAPAIAARRTLSTSAT